MLHFNFFFHYFICYYLFFLLFSFSFPEIWGTLLLFVWLKRDLLLTQGVCKFSIFLPHAAHEAETWSSTLPVKMLHLIQSPGHAVLAHMPSLEEAILCIFRGLFILQPLCFIFCFKCSSHCFNALSFPTKRLLLCSLRDLSVWYQATLLDPHF